MDSSRTQLLTIASQSARSHDVGIPLLRRRPLRGSIVSARVVPSFPQAPPARDGATTGAREPSDWCSVQLPGALVSRVGTRCITGVAHARFDGCLTSGANPRGWGDARTAVADPEGIADSSPATGQPQRAPARQASRLQRRDVAGAVLAPPRRCDAHRASLLAYPSRADDRRVDDGRRDDGGHDGVRELRRGRVLLLASKSRNLNFTSARWCI